MSIQRCVEILTVHEVFATDKCAVPLSIGCDVLASNGRLPQSAPFLAQQPNSITLTINYLRRFKKNEYWEKPRRLAHPKIPHIPITCHYQHATSRYIKWRRTPECTTRKLVLTSHENKQLLVPVIQTVPEQYGGVRGTAHAHLPWRNASTVNCRLFKKYG